MIGTIKLKKYLDIKIQVMEKGTITNPINIATQKDANQVEVRISSDIGVQMMENLSVIFNKIY